MVSSGTSTSAPPPCLERGALIEQGAAPAPPSMTDQDFKNYQRFIYEAAGITLSSGKKALVAARLAKRLRHLQLDSYGAYFQLLASGSAPAELQMAVDLLTTNETYFFREPKHFEQLRQVASEARSWKRPFRVWSAASSTGEEAYSIAMVLADCLEAAPWEVLGSDISATVLQCARAGHYRSERATHIPAGYLQRFCLKGIGAQHGTLLVDRSLRSRVRFMSVNLNERLPQLGAFDIVFLRNVMLYFNEATRRDVVARVLSTLQPGGYFMIGHSETLQGITKAVQAVAPSIYRKPAR